MHVLASRSPPHLFYKHLIGSLQHLHGSLRLEKQQFSSRISHIPLACRQALRSGTAVRGYWDMQFMPLNRDGARWATADRQHSPAAAAAAAALLQAAPPVNPPQNHHQQPPAPTMISSVIFLAKGLREFTRGGYERAARAFDAAVLQRSLAGRRCMVTGANQGLGFQTSLELAKRGATLFMVCRNEARGQEAVEAVRRDSGNPDVHLKVGVWLPGRGCFAAGACGCLWALEWVGRSSLLRPASPSPVPSGQTHKQAHRQAHTSRALPTCPCLPSHPPQVCDLASLAAIKALAEDYLASGAPLDCLINNAGLMLHERTPSPDGFETNFAVNTLAAFALTLALEPALHAAGGEGGSGGRVVFVSSGGQVRACSLVPGWGSVHLPAAAVAGRRR